MSERRRVLSSKADVYGTIAAFVVPFAVYVCTMAPTVYGLDSAELTTGACTLGIVHSPGAPTYMLLGHLVSKIPVGDAGFRLNLLSALFGAATVTVVYRIARELRLSVDAALIGAGLLAFSFYFWAWALVAELYAPHAFFASTICLCLLRWRDTQQARFLLTGALLFGIGCGNHTSLVLLLPGYAWLTFSVTPSILRRPRLMTMAVFCAAVGLSVFAYLPLRQSAQPQIDYVSTYFPEVDLRTPAGLLWMLRGGMFESLFFSLPPADIAGQGVRFIHVLLSNFTPLGFGFAALGCWSLSKRNRAINTALALFFLVHSIFFLTYGALDKFWMFSVSYVVAAIWAAAGVAHAEQLLPRWTSHIPRHAARGTAAACVLLLLVVNYPLLNLSHDTSARDFGVFLGSKMEHRAVFFGLWEQMPILEYLQVAEGWRPDISLHSAVFLDTARVRKIVEQSLADGRPIYASRPELVPFSEITCSMILTNNLYLLTRHNETKGAQTRWQEFDAW